jgi:hypothetical protein
LFDGGEKMKPDFLILTFPKSGSTSLYETLKKHPDICLPLNKETWYFSREYPKGESWYRERFWHCNKYNSKKKVGEISTETLLKDEYLERMKETLPGAKIVVLLRDPLQRTVSHYYHSVREGYETRSFEEALPGKKKNEDSYVNEGIYKYGYLAFSLRYKSSIKALLNLYEMEKIKFILFENLIEEPVKVLHELQSFLEVKPITLSLMWENAAGISRGRSLKFLTGLPLRLYLKITRSSWLYKMVPVDKKRKTRKVRSGILALLKGFAGMSRKEFKKPPLSSEMKLYLIDCFNKELKGIEKMTGLPILEYWTWYQP